MSERHALLRAYGVCMARLNVYVPDELADQARAAQLNVSAVTQQAITTELDRHATDAWLATLPTPGGLPAAAVQQALGEARAEMGP